MEGLAACFSCLSFSVNLRTLSYKSVLIRSLLTFTWYTFLGIWMTILVCSNSIIIIVTVNLTKLNVTINNITVTHTIIITMKMVMRTMNTPVAQPPMNKPLTAAGEKELYISGIRL